MLKQHLLDEYVAFKYLHPHCGDGEFEVILGIVPVSTKNFVVVGKVLVDVFVDAGIVPVMVLVEYDISVDVGVIVTVDGVIVVVVYVDVVGVVIVVVTVSVEVGVDLPVVGVVVYVIVDDVSVDP